MSRITRVAAIAGAFIAVAKAGAETYPYDHVHLIATDPAAAVQWYVEHMDGEDIGEDDRLKFGNVLVIFFRRDAGFSGSEGSSVDHIGFSFTDLNAKMKAFREAGVKITQEARAVGDQFKFGFVEDLWGTKIEVMEDHETLGFHHIHLRGPEPGKILDWYHNAFGGEQVRFKDMLPSLRYGDVWVIATGAPEEQAPTQGRAIDHLGWTVSDMDAAHKALTEKGVKFTIKPRPFRDLKIAFVEGPGGVRIELVERP